MPRPVSYYFGLADTGVVSSHHLYVYGGMLELCDAMHSKTAPTPMTMHCMVVSLLWQLA
jgi:hypothetical protein